MSDELVLDEALLRKAVEWVESEAEKPRWESNWFQGHYVWDAESRNTAFEYSKPREYTCGTAYCVAGYVGQLVDERYADTDIVNDVHVSNVAQKALGMTPEQSMLLFDGCNSATDVRRVAEEIAGCAL